MEIKNTMVSVYFENCEGIRRNITNWEQIFSPQFLPSSILPIPEQAPPEITRAVFQSHGGHSFLNFSNNSAILNTRFDNGYETNFKKCVDNLQEKVKCIYEFLISINVKILYVGLTTTMILNSNNDPEPKDIDDINQKMNRIKSDIPLYDYSNRMAFVIKNDFFVNISFANVRKSNIIISENPLFPNVPDNAEQNIEITVDVNDKHAFFTNATYNSEESKFKQIIDLSYGTIEKIDGLILKGEINFNE